MIVREVVENGIAIRLDLSEQILALDAPEDARYAEPELSPVPAATDSLLSASVLAQKAKQFDDALYAAVELVAQHGHGAVRGKREWLRRWADAAIAAGEHGEAATLLLAACELGGAQRALPAGVSANVRSAIDRFLGDPNRSAPLGFYTQSDALAAIFRQDRMLMTELGEPEQADALARVLQSDSELLRSYQTQLALASRLTNPRRDDAFDLLASAQPKGRRILPPSRSPEGDLMERLYNDRPIPDGFDLAEEVASRVAAGSLSLAPRADSGWYAHQLFALEPLVAPERAPEAERLRYSHDYRLHLRGLFKAIFALTRETHVKQLEPVACAAAWSETRTQPIYVKPELTLEPLATHYARRALGYRFVRGVLGAQFGPAWREIAFGDDKASWKRVGDGLDAIEALFCGASALVRHELGLPPAPALPDRDPDADAAALQIWIAELGSDPDLARDSRMMVPAFYDLGRRKMKVWALLGWSDRPLTVGFHQPPRVLDHEPKPVGRLAELRHRFFGPSAETQATAIEFVPAYHRVALPITAELYVDRVLDRDAFRQLCDQHKTRPNILRALGALR